MAIVLPQGKQQFFTATGAPAVGWKLYAYIPTTTTPKDTYTDSGELTQNTHPVVADARGEMAIYWSGDYDVVLKDDAGATIWGPERLNETELAGAADTLRADLATTNNALKGAALVGYSVNLAYDFGTVGSKLLRYVSVYDYLPDGFVTTNDATTYIQSALDSGATVVDFLGIALKCNEIEVPANVWANNVSLTKYTNAAGNVVIVNTGSTVTGKIAGTGLVSAVQRCIYPAADGVTDVRLNVEVTNATYGVHAEYLTTDSDANRPKRWTGYVYAHDIVGTVGASEGYGVLLSPANACQLTVNAKTIARHAVYLSNGARDNDITATVDDCGNYAVQLYSTTAQSATQYNTIRINAKNLTEDTAGQGGAAAVVQKAHYNTLIVNHEGNNTTSYSVLVEGSSGGPYPLGNKIINGNITGQFVGLYVIRLLNADSTHVQGNTLHCYGTAGVVGMLKVGTNGITHGGYVEGNEINAQAQAVKGIYNEITTVPSYIGPNEITNNSTSLRVDDSTSGMRYGYSRRVRFSGTTASITNASTGDTAPTLARELQVTGRRRTVQITGASVSLTANSNVTAVLTPASETAENFRIYNAHGVSQTFDYEGWAEGD